MGIVRMGPPEELILLLRDRFHLSTFVETGTYQGGTATWAAKHFKRVVTVENSRTVYDDTLSRCGHISNIEFIFNDSRLALRELLPALSASCVFWLDGHWCGMDDGGMDDQCPLLGEISEINKSDYDHFLLIDDARLFTSPPPRPNSIAQWPAIDEVIDSLKSGNPNRYILIFEDVIIAVPEFAKEVVAEFCQNANTLAWARYGASQAKVARGKKPLSGMISKIRNIFSK